MTDLLKRIEAHRIDLARISEAVRTLSAEIDAATDEARKVLGEYQTRKRAASEMLGRASEQYRAAQQLLGKVAMIEEPLLTAKRCHIELTRALGELLKREPDGAEEALRQMREARETFKVLAREVEQWHADVYPGPGG